MQKLYDIIVITGPTATGKTSLATKLASEIDGEIISADSRQVYKNMNIGTGKDLHDYVVDDKKINHYLIDIVEPGYHYNVFEFQKDFVNAYNEIANKGKKPILCGGTGMYIEAALAGYKLIEVPENKDLRKSLSKKSMQELINMLSGLTKLHNKSDTTDKNRLIRAIEIETFYKENPNIKTELPKLKPIIFAVNLPREVVRERITKRLRQRLDAGMIKEVEDLLNSGLKPQQLTYYGLEYKYITNYLTGDITFDEMFKSLNTAIHQFAKRQMTWFRRMERKGFDIIWVKSYDEIKNHIF
ncbi:MAG: tRNA (adenosine(37)-N6)-dimethylallyltransferase MiaA [Bacteroidales bacterium]